MLARPREKSAIHDEPVLARWAITSVVARPDWPMALRQATATVLIFRVHLGGQIERHPLGPLRFHRHLN